mgnify:CR=1 FL=1
MQFTHLHVHSHYSVLDGMSKISDLINTAVANGMYSLALTDHGAMYGIKEFAQLADGYNKGISDKIKAKQKLLTTSEDVDKANIEEEIAKAKEKIAYFEKFLEGVMKKLSNERFVANANPEVVELERKKKSDAESKIKTLQESINNLLLQK